MTESLTKWQRQTEAFARVRALILQILNKHPEGLTYNQVSDYFFFKHSYRPKTDNRLRELVAEGLATKRVVGNRMRFFVSSEGDTS